MLFFKLLKMFIYFHLFERQSDRKKPSQELRILPRSPSWVAVTQELEPLFPASQNTLARIYILRRTTKTQTSTLIWDEDVPINDFTYCATMPTPAEQFRNNFLWEDDSSRYYFKAVLYFIV